MSRQPSSCRRAVAVVLTGLGLAVADVPRASGAPPVRPGVQRLPARSASEASQESVWQTQRNSRRYRRKKEEERREDREKARALAKQPRHFAPRQPGGYCMYDTHGNVILQPEGVECEEPEGEYMRARGGPASIAPGRSGCVEGDCRSGQGVYLWSNGAQYIGGFHQGLQHGEGLLVMPDGATWEGSWRLGRKHGEGVATYSDGRVQEGLWKDGRWAGRREPRAPGIRWPDLSKPTPEAIGGGERDAAVIVGVGRYARVAEVPGAALNAADWYAYLVKVRGVPLDRVDLLLDEDATVEEMRFAVQQAARQVRRKGTLWFVFVGHGAASRDGTDGLLVGFDAQQKARSIEARSLRRSELTAALQQSRAERIHVLLDACFSGRTPSGAPLVAGLQPLVLQAPASPSDPRITLLTAAASDEYAGPLPGAARPAFSYLALGGLRGWADGDRDGEITSGELHGYVSQTLRVLVRGRRQRPTLVGDEDHRLAESGRESGPDIAKLVVEAARRR